MFVFLGVGFRKNENKGDHTADILISGALRKLKNNAVPETLTVVTSTKSAASCHFPTQGKPAESSNYSTSQFKDTCLLPHVFYVGQ